MNDDLSRRHVETRGKKWAVATARWLSGLNITPNQISWTSILFAAICAGFLLLASQREEWWMWIGALICIQGRLLCNLFDGMVAVEGGKKTASGEIFNDFPDRISDPLIIVATGYAISGLPYACLLGWIAGMSAVLTAYARFLGAACGAGQNFMGPMAKQHRMALLSVASLVAGIFSAAAWHQWVVYGALCLMTVGCVITIFRRLSAAVRKLEASSEVS